MQVQAFSDGQMWTNAICVRICFEGPWTGSYWSFVNDGTSGDAVAGDGVYSRTAQLTSTMGEYTIYAIARSEEPGLVRESHVEHLPRIDRHADLSVSPTNPRFRLCSGGF